MKNVEHSWNKQKTENKSQIKTDFMSSQCDLLSIKCVSYFKEQKRIITFIKIFKYSIFQHVNMFRDKSTICRKI